MTEKMTYAKALEIAIEAMADNAEVAEKLEALKASLAKRNSKDRKPTAKQTENKGLCDAIVAYLTNGEKHTVSELMKCVPELASIEDITNQRVSALVRNLVEDNILVREEIKRKAYFKLA